MRRSTMMRGRRDSSAPRMHHNIYKGQQPETTSKIRDQIYMANKSLNSSWSSSMVSTWSTRCKSRQSMRWRDCGDPWDTCHICTSIHLWMTTWEHSLLIVQEYSEHGHGRTVPESSISLTSISWIVRSMASIFQSSMIQDRPRQNWKLVKTSWQTTSCMNLESQRHLDEIKDSFQI